MIDRLERKDMHLKNSMARVNALEEDIRVLGNDLDREQHRHRETQMKVTVSVNIKDVLQSDFVVPVLELSYIDKEFLTIISGASTSNC